MLGFLAEHTDDLLSLIKEWETSGVCKLPEKRDFMSSDFSIHRMKLSNI